MTDVFEEKWKFNFFYSNNMRVDLLRFVDLKKSNIAVLEAGCGMGANFTY